MVWATCCAQNTGSDAYAYEQVEIVQDDHIELCDAEAEAQIAPRLLGRNQSDSKQAKATDLQQLAPILAEFVPDAGVAAVTLAQARSSFSFWLAPEEMQWEHAEVTRLVSKFCEEPALGVPIEPASEELDIFWRRCEGLDPCLVSAVLADQLALGGDAWQPCFRTLCVLEHGYLKGGAAKGVAEGAHTVAGSTFSALLSQTPECRLKVLQLLLAKLRADGHSGKAHELEAKLDQLGLHVTSEEFKSRRA